MSPIRLWPGQDQVEGATSDACWNLDGVKIEKVDPVLLSFSDEGKKMMQQKYYGDIRPASCSPVEREATYLKFFQTDRNGNPKGIVKLALTGTFQ